MPGRQWQWQPGNRDAGDTRLGSHCLWLRPGRCSRPTCWTAAWISTLCVLLHINLRGVVLEPPAGAAKLARRPLLPPPHRGGLPRAAEHTAPHAPAPRHCAGPDGRAGGPPGCPRRSRVLPGGGMRSMRLLAPSSCCWSTGAACPALQAPASGPRAAASMAGVAPRPRTLTCSTSAGQRLREEAEAGGGAHTTPCGGPGHSRQMNRRGSGWRRA